MTDLQPKPDAPWGGFGIYIHWPFCRSKCPYCDFNSHVRAGIDQDLWREALLRDLRTQMARAERPPVQSIFFGGGTPSLMAPKTAALLIDEIARTAGFADDVEITLEANPTSVESDTFADFASAGVNRFSLGIQALDDTALKFLGREHSRNEALLALDRAVSSGARTSFDLIYARPEQSLADWRDELTRALAFGVEHMSLYQLTLEPGTGFTRAAERGELILPDEDLAADLFDLTQEMMGQAAMPGYEISNHAKAGAEARHNLVYWRGGSYLGIGPGAHGRVMVDGQRRATICQRTPEDWLRAIESNGHGLIEDRALSPGDQAEEYVLMGLRLSEGISLARFESLAGRPLVIDDFVKDGLLVADRGMLKATASGRLVLNRLISELL